MLGLKRGMVRLVEHDPGWPTAFSSERALLFEALAGLGCAIEHVGSTAVPGLPAKPILDIAVGVPVDVEETACIPRLEQCAPRGAPGSGRANQHMAASRWPPTRDARQYEPPWIHGAGLLRRHDVLESLRGGLVPGRPA
jgi:GrpB-like predicted nucleotidyltransferase (UPF0157 family)